MLPWEGEGLPVSVRHVLVVDDEPAVCEFLGLALRAMGFSVHCALDGPSALAHAAKQPPCFAVVDALLPKMDGFQVVAALRQAQPELPVVMMSGIYKKRNYESEALDRLGCKAYVHKPLSVLHLWELVETHAGLPAAGAVPPDFPGVSFRKRPYPQVVADLHDAKETGLLFVRGSGGTAIVFFEDGRIVFGRSNDPQTRLDRVLLASGAIDAKTMARARDVLAASRGSERFGELLVREGLVTAERLQASLAEQQRQHVLRPFTWADGSCHFFRSDAPRAERFKLALDMPPLVFWGCRQVRDEASLGDWLPGPDRRPCLSRPLGDLAEAFALSPAEREFVALLDGTRDVTKLRAIGRLAQVDVNRLLAGLLCTGLVEIANADEPPLPAPDASAVRAVPTLGDLARLPAAPLLAMMHAARASGVLRVEAEGSDSQAVRTVYLQGGGIACATSNSPQDRLGQVLVRHGIVRPDQVAAALEAARTAPSTGLGRILLDQGALTPDDLHRGLVAQVHGVVAGLLSWRSGTFHFQEGPLPLKDIVPLHLDTPSVVLRAVRGMAFTDIAPHLPSPDVAMARTWNAPALAAALPLGELERRLTAALDAPTPIRELFARLHAPPEEVLRAVHALLVVGVIEGRAPTRPASGLPSASASAARTAATPAPQVEVEEFGDTLVGEPEDPGERAEREESFGSLGDDAPLDLVGGWPVPEPQPASPPPAAEFDPGDADLDDALAGLAGASGPPPASLLDEDRMPAVGVIEPDEVAAVAQFLALLGAWQDGSAAGIPPHVLETLPPAVRRRFGLEATAQAGGRSGR